MINTLRFDVRCFLGSFHDIRIYDSAVLYIDVLKGTLKISDQMQELLLSGLLRDCASPIDLLFPIEALSTIS